MLGLVDRRQIQENGVMDVTYGEFNVIIVGDIAQLPLALNRPLYSPLTEYPISIFGFLDPR